MPLAAWSCGLQFVDKVGFSTAPEMGKETYVCSRDSVLQQRMDFGKTFTWSETSILGVSR
jgi:hypothetical protein